VGQRSGKLINFASMWGLARAASVAPIPAYNAAKGAVVNLTRELALEYATQNIQVNAICPGFFRTRLAADPGNRWLRERMGGSRSFCRPSDASPSVNPDIARLDASYPKTPFFLMRNSD
jgi:NAD(P)-dependent dehydrogenase (short-subunit alcohol dehydrogenase family)